MRLVVLASAHPDYSLELAGALAAHAEVTVLADADALARERDGAPTPGGVELRPFRQSNPLRRWGGAAGLGAALARMRPAAVIAHEHPHPHLSALLRLASAIAPVGLIVHDVEPHPGRDALFAARRRAEILAQRRLARQLFAHGSAACAKLERSAGRPVTALRHGPILRPADCAPPPPGDGRVLMLGRMEAYKGLDVLVEAAERLRDTGRPLSLEVRGHGPELDRLRPRLQALPTCRLAPGRASRPELLAALAGCDLVAAPYLQASASGVAAAALANGRGLVASTAPGLADMARDGINAVRAPCGDAQALAAALVRGLADARRLGEGARTLAEGPFAWARAAETLVGALAAARRRAA